MMEWLRLIFTVIRGVAPIFAIPAATYWSLWTLNPLWYIQYTTHSIAAFWLLYGILRLGIRTIQSPDWPEWWSYE